MKTKEEILRETASGIYAIPGDYPESVKELREAIIKAMQLYSDQQNKELREKAGKAIADNTHEYVLEIQRLTKEVELLKKLVRDISNALNHKP